MKCVVLCGGSGTRLWPLSRKTLPKQFVKIFNDRSLFQLTLTRNEMIADESIFVVGKDQYFLALDQAVICNTFNSKFLLEPIGRNTAPAIALACMSVDAEELILVTTSDHLIKNLDAFQSAVNEAALLANDGHIVTLGIKPDYPETGYGYIEHKGNDVISFHEKPRVDDAKSFVESGNFLWNSGMFCFKAGVLLEELKRLAPEVFDRARNAFDNSTVAGDVVEFDLANMKLIPEISIDYAVMEKTNLAKVIPCNLGWSDLGSFDALYQEVLNPKESLNASVLMFENTPEPIFENAKHNLVVADKSKIVLIDVEDLQVVDTHDSILISKKGSSQKVKKIVKQLKEDKSELIDFHRKVYRPWGWYDNLEQGLGFKVKRILVKPGARLSLQKHYHRAEHWVVVRGTAEITNGDQNFILTENESTYIPLGHVHRLSNPGEMPLEIIEVQTGSFLSEDDIVRIEDKYGRI